MNFGDPRDPLFLRIREYEGVVFEFSNFHGPSVENWRMMPFYSHAMRFLRDAQGSFQPFDNIPGNMFSYTDRHDSPSLTLAVRGLNGQMWGLAYEDVEEVINALSVYVRQWTSHGSKPKSTYIRVFRHDTRLRTYGIFEVGSEMTD